MIDTEFAERRSRTLARLCSYALSLIFLVSVLTALVPGQAGEPGTLFSFLNEVVERSTLPLVGLFLFHFGFCGDARPALWECRMAALVQHLLRLLVVLYLLLAIAVVGIGAQVRGRDLGNLGLQLQANTKGLDRFEQLVQQAPNSEALARLITLQPGLSEALRQDGGPAPDPGQPLPEQRDRVMRLLERNRANIQRQHLLAVATTTANSVRIIGRLCLLAALYTLFYLAASFIWPRSMAATIATLRLNRQEEARQEAEAASL